jgi:hypothetical protein
MEKQEIIKALIEFQSKAPKLELNSSVNVKLKSGGSYNFKYADLPYIMDTIQETLTKCKLAVYFQIAELEISIVIAHESGQFIISSLPLQFGNNPQDNGSIITYYKRYLLTSALNLVAEQDDDANVSLDNDFTKKEKSKENDIKEWLSEEQFNAALKGTYKQIMTTLTLYSKDGKGMKKDYRKALKEKAEEWKANNDNLKKEYTTK